MRKLNVNLKSAATAAALLLLLAPGAGAVVEPEGCCCIQGKTGMDCAASSEKDCLAKQQAAPRYDEKTGWDKAEKESAAQEAGKMTSGWHAGKCPAK